MYYPKWIYHETEAPKIVNTKEEHDQAGKGWEETPAAFDEKSNEAKEESTPNQDAGNKESDIKEVDFTKMTVKELHAALLKNGKNEADLKGLKKDQLIVLLGEV